MGYKGANIDTGNWHRPDIIKQLNDLNEVGAKLIRFQILLAATTMADWTVEQYWAWLKDVCQVFEDITPVLMANQQPTIVDFHHAVGGFRGGKWRVFHNDALMKAHTEMVAYVADRFKNNDACFAIEPFNEPAPRSSAQLRSCYESIISAIRKTGFNKHIVIDHRGSDCANMKGAKPFRGSGPILYSVHMYKPAAVLQPDGRQFAITKDQIRSYLKYAIKFSKDYGADMVVGEFGCRKSSGNGKNQAPWIQTCVDVFNEWNQQTEGKVSWCWHSMSYQPDNIFGIPDAQFKTLWR